MIIQKVGLLTLWTILLGSSRLKEVNSALMQDVDQLYEDLFYNYMKNVKPTKNATDVVNVQLSAMLIQIVDIDEKSQIMAIHLFMQLRWNDSRLVWPPSSYGGTTRINIPSEQIWTPDIVLYNNADGVPQLSGFTDAFVCYDGQIFWTVPQIYKAFCKIDITFFPYDSQKCYLKFGAWTHDGYHIALFPDMKDQTFVNVTDEEDLEINQGGNVLLQGMDLLYYKV